MRYCLGLDIDKGLKKTLKKRGNVTGRNGFIFQIVRGWESRENDIREGSIKGNPSECVGVGSRMDPHLRILGRKGLFIWSILNAVLLLN